MPLDQPRPAPKGDGLGHAPRPGEPESALLPGMSAPRPPAAPEKSPPVPFGRFGHLQLGSMPDTSGPGPFALESPFAWAYDFDPATNFARATYPGIVIVNGVPVGTGVLSFNTRTGAVLLTTADVAAVLTGPTVGAVAVQTFNTRIGAVTLTAADVAAAMPGDFYAINSATQNPTGVGIVMAFANVISGNSGTWFNTGTNRYTPPAGRYHLFSRADFFNGGATAGSITFAIRKNGANAIVGQPTVIVGAQVSSSVFGNLDANGTDFFEVFVAVNAASQAQVPIGSFAFGAFAIP